jgi:hypothetical protein
MFAAFPLMALVVLAYDLIFLVGPGGLKAEDAQARLGQELFEVPMVSGVNWSVGLGDLLLATALVLLFIELLKSTSSRRVAIVNHALSMLLFVLCLVEFLLLRACASSTFFLISLMVLLDVLAGFIVTIASARREVDLNAD